ncbi:hypothetical protein [Hyphobacterium sp.]|uniref:hypothetical protein n=1 Tax=Hyphobacterium sp. TaxID=2004662 RepID=UPI003BA9D381
MHRSAIAGISGAFLLAACSPDQAVDEVQPDTSDDNTESAAETEAPRSTDDETAGLPDTDIAVATMTWQDGLPVIDQPRIYTTQGLYDNQPAFDEAGGFYFTTETPGNQTDIRYMRQDGTVSVFTATPDISEYSARRSPDGTSVTYIRQAPGDVGGQVYRTRVDGASSAPVHPYGPSGYYALSGDQSVMLLFALTDPFTLRWADNDNGIERQVTAEPGRGLYSSPDGQSAYFTLAHAEGGFTIHEYDFASDSILELFRLPGESQDYAVFLNPEGQLSWLSSSGDTLFYRDEDHASWQSISDLGGMGFSGVTRLAVSPQADRIAIVFEE